MQQRLGGDAAAVQAGAAEHGVLLDHGDLQAELAGADGGDVAAGAAADDDEVVVEAALRSGGGRGLAVRGSRGGGCRRRCGRGLRWRRRGRGLRRRGGRRLAARPPEPWPLRLAWRLRLARPSRQPPAPRQPRRPRLLARLADQRHHLRTGDRLAFLVADLEHHAGGRAGDLGVHLVGGDLEQRLVALDLVADLDQPLGDRALGDRLAHLGHHDFGCHSLISSLSPGCFVDQTLAGTTASARKRPGRSPGTRRASGVTGSCSKTHSQSPGRRLAHPARLVLHGEQRPEVVAHHPRRRQVRRRRHQVGEERRLFAGPTVDEHDAHPRRMTAGAHHAHAGQRLRFVVEELEQAGLDQRLEVAAVVARAVALVGTEGVRQLVALQEVAGAREGRHPGSFGPGCLRRVLQPQWSKCRWVSSTWVTSSGATPRAASRSGSRSTPAGRSKV